MSFIRFIVLFLQEILDEQDNFTGVLVQFDQLNYDWQVGERQVKPMQQHTDDYTVAGHIKRCKITQNKMKKKKSEYQHGTKLDHMVLFLSIYLTYNKVWPPPFERIEFI